MTKTEYIELLDVVTKLNSNLKSQAQKEHWSIDPKVHISLECLPFHNDHIRCAILVHAFNTSFIIWNDTDDNEKNFTSPYNGRIYYEKSNTWESWLKLITRRWKEIRESFHDLTITNNLK